MNVALLYGGFSAERDISIKSGMAVLEALKNLGYNVFPIDVKEPVLPPLKGIDVVFIALHGEFGEDGTLQSLLDKEGIPYIGSDASASRKAWDKIIAKNIFKEAGLLTPPYEVVEVVENFEENCTLPLPWMVKPARQGSTIGTSFVKEKKDFLPAYENARRFDGKVFVESYIEGRELTVSILGNEALPPVEILPKEKKFFDYYSKYTEGATVYKVPAPIPPSLYRKVQEEALCAFKAIGCKGFARVDMKVQDEKVFILEVNTIPGLTKLSLFPKAAAAAGISFEELIKRIIELALT